MVPNSVSIVLTDLCNLQCITCWSFSPLNKKIRELAEPRTAKAKNRKILPFEVLEQLLQDLARLKVKRVSFTGGGDPLVYKKFNEAVALARRLGLKVTVISNLVLIKNIEEFCSLDMNNISVNFSSADAESYQKFHHNQDVTEFSELMQNLGHISRTATKIKLVFVLCNINYKLLPQLLQIAISLGADIQFKLMAGNGFTDILALSYIQRRIVLEQIPLLKKIILKHKITANIDSLQAQLQGSTALEFPVDQIGCFAGQIYSRINAAGEVRFCCNPNQELTIGSLIDNSFEEIWRSYAYDYLRERINSGHFFTGCQQCGKFEMNHSFYKKIKSTLPVML